MKKNIIKKNNIYIYKYIYMKYIINSKNAENHLKCLYII